MLDRLAELQRAAARQRHLPGPAGPAAPRRPTALVDLRTAYARIYRAVAEVTGARVVVDASKGPALGQALAGAPGIDLRMLNVVRDPRAVAWSWNRAASSARTPRPAAEQMWRIPAHRSAAPVERPAAGDGGHRPAGRRPVGAASLRGLRRRPRRHAGRSDRRARPPARRPPTCPPSRTGRVVLGPSHGLSGNPGRFRSGPVELRRDDALDDRDAHERPSGRDRAHPAPAHGATATRRHPLGTAAAPTPRPRHRRRKRRSHT